jgi:hypothetical protein
MTSDLGCLCHVRGFNQDKPTRRIPLDHRTFGGDGQIALPIMFVFYSDAQMWFCQNQIFPESNWISTISGEM